MVTTSNLNNIPESLFSNGCCGNGPEPIDVILSTKLSNIWSQRQSIKGEAGETFETTDLIVRAVNLFSSAGFKGLLIELTSNEGASQEEFEQKLENIRSILEGLSMKETRISYEQLDSPKTEYLCDLAYQYVRLLNF